ncbi:hypothetical protein EJB05_56516, partial [Eragrostis curvula]
MPATIPSDILWSPLYISASVSTEAAAVVYDTALSPAPAVPLNLIEILMKACQYNAFMRLLKDTEVSSQVASLLDGAGGRNAHGVTGLTPTDEARNAEPDGRAVAAGALPHPAQLILQLRDFRDRPPGLDPARRMHRQRDQTTGGGERQQVNVLAGMAEATLGRPLYSAYPLAVYSVDTVMLPPDLFGHAAVKDGVEAGGVSPGRETFSPLMSEGDNDGDDGGIVLGKATWRIICPNGNDEVETILPPWNKVLRSFPVLSWLNPAKVKG